MDENSTIQRTLVLRRFEPEQNVARFYALMIERDLFGRIVLVRHWGGSVAEAVSAWMSTPAKSRQPKRWAGLPRLNVGGDTRTCRAQPETVRCVPYYGQAYC